MTVTALVLGAGRGERLDHPVPKAFVELVGRPLIERSLAALCACSAVDRVVPVVAADDLERLEALKLDQLGPKLAPAVAGGVERQDSVAAGLRAVPGDDALVAVHDAARCLVEPNDVERVIRAARVCGAALLARPVRDTIKRVRDDEIVETPAREECWAAQTPQVFRVELLREALEKAQAEGFVGTDDAQLVERLGARVRVVLGSERNIKITLADDLAIAERLLAAASPGSP